MGGAALALKVGSGQLIFVRGGSSLKHDVCSLAEAGGVFNGHAAVCDVVGVQAQMLQVGEVGRRDVLAETG